MFKVGANYEFRMIEAGEEMLFWGTVEKYEHPLLKLEDVDPGSLKITEAETGSIISEMKMEGTVRGRIINVTSPNFVSAEEQD